MFNIASKFVDVDVSIIDGPDLDEIYRSLKCAFDPVKKYLVEFRLHIPQDKVDSDVSLVDLRMVVTGIEYADETGTILCITGDVQVAGDSDTDFIRGRRLFYRHRSHLGNVTFKVRQSNPL